jgi:hypothetical protein
MNGTTIERTIIRDAPGGDPIGSIPPQTQITFTQQGTWLLLSSAGGAARTGYVNARSVKFEQTPPPPPPPDTPPAGTTVTNIIKVYSDGSILVIPQ